MLIYPLRIDRHFKFSIVIAVMFNTKIYYCTFVPKIKKPRKGSLELLLYSPRVTDDSFLQGLLTLLGNDYYLQC